MKSWHTQMLYDKVKSRAWFSKMYIGCLSLIGSTAQVEADCGEWRCGTFKLCLQAFLSLATHLPSFNISRNYMHFLATFLFLSLSRTLQVDFGDWAFSRCSFAKRRKVLCHNSKASGTLKSFPFPPLGLAISL
jgi:hypothetical protein